MKGYLYDIWNAFPSNNAEICIDRWIIEDAEKSKIQRNKWWYHHHNSYIAIISKPFFIITKFSHSPKNCLRSKDKRVKNRSKSRTFHRYPKDHKSTDNIDYIDYFLIYFSWKDFWYFFCHRVLFGCEFIVCIFLILYNQFFLFRE